MPRLSLAAWLVATVVVAAPGCSPGSVSSPDAANVDGDGAVVGDDGGGGPPTLLRFEIELDPHIPGDFGGPHKLRVESIRLDLVNIRAIGDAAPGDERTTINGATLSWQMNDLEVIAYADAPPGIYSSFIADVERLRMQGEIDPPGPGKISLTIDDEPPGLQSINVSLGAGHRLDPGKTETIEIDVELGAGLTDLPWDTYPVEDGEIEIDEEDVAEISEIRAAFFDAWVSR